MANLFKQAQKMQEQMEEVQKTLETRTAEGAAGGGVVTATVNGKLRLLHVKIDPEVVDPEDTEMLEDLIVAAVNQALEHAQDMAQEEMRKVTGGMFGGLPEGMNLPGFGV